MRCPEGEDKLGSKRMIVSKFSSINIYIYRIFQEIKIYVYYIMNDTVW